jgi:type VI secretion system secreted protein Hcp
MAGLVYLKLTGNKQGEIQGSSTNTDFSREHSIECTAFTLKVVSPRDKATGLASGRRYYEPILFMKNIDQATPGIARALVENEVITSAEFRFFGVDATTGVEALVYTVTAESGRISSQRQFVADTLDPALMSRPPQEEVGLVFTKITWSWANPAISGQDTWGAP